MALSATGCTPHGRADVERPVWSSVTLPAGVNPVTLTAFGSQLLVGGRTESGPVHPRLLTLSADGAITDVALSPHSGYAFEATWRSLVAEGDRIIGVGGAPGGAHSNTRWTTWTGTSAGVVEEPQTFGTFGGLGAGDLIAPVVTRAGTAIAGTWQGAQVGLDAAIWLPRGPDWIRQSSAGTALEGTADLLVGAHAAAAAGAGIVLAGSVIHVIEGNIHQSAAAWRSGRLNQGWARVDLPQPGANSAVVSVNCAADSCVLAGYVDGRLALWSLSGSQATRIDGVPDIATDLGARTPAPILGSDTIIQVASARDAAVVLTRRAGSWVRAAGPAGVATSSALVGNWLYVITEQPDGISSLWRIVAMPTTVH